MSWLMRILVGLGLVLALVIVIVLVIGNIGTREETTQAIGELTALSERLRDLIEDELLLGLPMSPLHEPEMCPAVNMTREHAPGRHSPFAVLKDLKSGKQ